MKNTEQGMLLIFFGAFFLLMGLEMIEFNFRIVEPGTSVIIAVIALTYGVYQVAKGWLKKKQLHKHSLKIRLIVFDSFIVNYTHNK